MTIPSGSRLGPYEVLALLGSGGMGEVYRVRDTKLNRDVALKVLPEAFAADPERLARFTREAQTLATINHPNIVHIHGLEDSLSILRPFDTLRVAPSMVEGRHAQDRPEHGRGATGSGEARVRALVMELVEGENLAARIARGALPLNEALPIARQIADALEAAHERGIVHRDLKPANIMLTADGLVKVLDFGLAKALEPAAGSDAANSPTLTFQATQLGVILGTAAYMSPEQAKGRVVDKRSDVWAFGCVLYEMLTGRRAFDGEDVTDTIAVIVRGEPDWSALPPEVPEQIRLLLKRCLEKDRRARVPDIGVARFLMTETFALPAADAGSTRPGLLTPTSGPRSRRRMVAAAGAGLLAVIGLLASAVWLGTRLVPRPVVQPARFTLVPPAFQPQAFTGTTRDLAISPDGTHIVYPAGLYPVTAELAVRALNDLNPRTLTGTAAAREPFMSPDGRWIGFFITPGEMRKVSITGGPPITICKIAFAPRGATWGADNTIIFAVSDPRTGLMSVSAGGGEPKVLTIADTSKGEMGHFYPSLLPGGRFVLFTIAAASQVENAQIAVLDLKTGERKTLIRGGSDAVYADPSTGSGQAGYLVYAAGGSLRAVRFDAARLEVAGDPVPVVDQVMTRPTGHANYALSRQGTLVYVPGGAAAPTVPLRTLVWVNRQGQEEPFKAPPRPYAVARLSPDGTRVALDVRDQSNDIWIWDVGRQTLTPLNVHPATDMSPLWTPDGRRVIWTSSRGGGNPNVFWQSADGTGAVERLTTNVQAQFPTSISADGTRVALFGGEAMATGTSIDISVLNMEGGSTPHGTSPRRAEPLLQSAGFKQNGEISPDGRWIAYQSNESGHFQVYVRPFPKVDEGRWQISPDGGTRPMWARHGRELFYLDGNDHLTSVPVQANATTFSPGTPTQILERRYYPGSTSRGYDLRAYDVSPDGQRFLMIKDTEPAEQRSPAAPASMTVVLNWFEELKARVPAVR